MQMNNNKGQSIFLTIIALLTLIVAIVGTCFGWIAITIQSSKDDKEIKNKMVVTKVIFNNGYDINIKNNISYDTQIKRTFTISNFDNLSTDKINYNVYLNIEKDTLTREINENGEYFTNSLYGRSKNNKGNLSEDLLNKVIETKEKILLTSATLYGDDIHTYEYVIDIKKSDKDIKLLNSKEFKAYITVETKE